MKLRTKLLNNKLVRWIIQMTWEEKAGLAIAFFAAIGANVLLRVCLNGSSMHRIVKEAFIFLATAVILAIGWITFILIILILEILIEGIIKRLKKRA